MEEQVNVVVEKPKSKKRTPILVLAALVIVAAVAAYMILGKMKPNDPAAFIPQEATFAITIDATSTADKKAALKYTVEMFKEAGIKIEKKDIAEINKQLGLDVEKDVLEHLNSTGAFAVLTEMAGAAPEMAGAIGIKSNGEAKALMTIIENQLTKNKITFSKFEYAGESCLRISTKNPMGDIPTQFSAAELVFYVGAVKNSITITNSENAFKKMVDVAQGKPSLLAEKNYTSLRNNTSAAFATSYYSGGNLYKLVGPMLQVISAMAPPGTADNLKEGIENNISTVCTAEATADGLTFTTRGITKDSGITGKTSSIYTLMAGAPKDAAILISMNNFRDTWTQYKKQIEKNPSAKAEMDKAFAQVKEAVGLDISKDVLDRIKSLQIFYVPKAPEKPQGFPGALNVVLTVDKPDVMTESMKKLHLVMATMGGVTVKPTNIAGQPGFLASIDKDYLSEVMMGDKLILSLGVPGAAKHVISVYETNDKMSSEGFQLVKKYLPNQSEFLVFGDIGQIVDTFAEKADPDMKSVIVISHKVGRFGIVGTSTPTSYELLTVVPFGK
ncbi:MAG: DUF3352 domain-containing protein [Armatimonadetes bacterium]|nr:DUF3352 domain-containing protein [Armatimonadota bacterium]